MARETLEDLAKNIQEQDIRTGQHWYYIGDLKPYIVLTVGYTKNPETDQWVMSVTYVKEGDVNNVVFTRFIDDFKKKFRTKFLGAKTDQT